MILRRRGLVAFTLLAVAVAGGLAVWQLRPAPPPPPVNPARSDYILENFELVSLDEAGKESFSVSAPRLERDPRGKSLTLQLPRFSFPDKDGGRWLATSKTAWVAEKGVEVRLIDRVELVGPPTPTGDRTRFSTARLQVFPKQDLALSQDRVTVSRATLYCVAPGCAPTCAANVSSCSTTSKDAMRRPRPDSSRSARLMILLLAIGVAASAQAKTTDRNAPMDINAGHSDALLTDDGTTTLSQGVVITQGTLEVRSDTARLFRAGGELSRIVLTGAPAVLKQVNDNGEPMTARASQIVYTVDSDVVVLTGAVTIEQPRGNLRGENVTYDLKTGRLNGGGDGSRVQMRIMPKSATTTPPAEAPAN